MPQNGNKVHIDKYSINFFTPRLPYVGLPQYNMPQNGNKKVHDCGKSPLKFIVTETPAINSLDICQKLK